MDVRTHSDNGARLLAFLPAFLRFAFIRVDDGDTGEFVAHGCWWLSAAERKRSEAFAEKKVVVMTSARVDKPSQIKLLQHRQQTIILSSAAARQHTTAPWQVISSAF